MKFGFIAGRTWKSFDCLAERAKSRGHEVVHIPLRDMPLSKDGLADFVQECVDDCDALHYYAGMADPVGIVFGEICEERGIPLLNNRSRLPQLIHDKMLQVLCFSKAGLPVPKTEFSRKPDWDSLTLKLGSPIVAKRARGTHGTHVHKLESAEELAAIEGASAYLFQEFIPHRNDVRVLVLKGKAICGYRRVPAQDDFRANLALGGYAEALADDAEKSETFALAEAAVRTMSHDLAGVDIIKSEDDGKYRLVEVNVNPSWYGIVELTDTCFEDALLDEYERMASVRK